MKKFPISIAAISLMALLIFVLQPEESVVSSLPASDKLDEKHFPDDQFFLQRAWPDAAFDIKAYTGAISDASEVLSTRGPAAFPGDWTVEGPGNIGARINTIAIHPTDAAIMYIGFARGGVWKTTDYGTNWAPIFDDQPFLAIGDIEIDPTNPDVVYVGTGDPNISGYPAIGDGVWKSMDAGSTWTHLGLEETRIVSKVLVDPANPNNIYVGTMGIPFEPNADRGLYKSTDGGLTWSQSLFISDDAGVCDLLINPDNPQVLYAAGWNRIRNNYESSVSGPNAKIFKTTDGGQNWTTLEGGLPQDDQGRIGLAMSGTDSDVIFAEYVGTNSQLFGIFKSTNGGQNWSEIPTNPGTGLSDSALGGFGWYFAKIRVNPNNDNDIFLLGVNLWRTTNGGQSWFLAAPEWWTYDVHADKHDLVFGPDDSVFEFILATDGGLYGNVEGWDYLDLENIPTSQFYRVAYNPHAPENYYGGMQDNGSSGGNASFINEWPRIYGGDGFQMAFHPFDPNIFLVQTQRGRINITFDGGFSFNFASDPIANDDRKNWDTPYQISAHNPEIVYSGSYKAWRGQMLPGAFTISWDSISGDLTKGVLTEPGFHTLSTLHESPLVEGLLYYGATDGNLSRTDNDGGSWTLITAGLPDRYVTDVKASPTFEDNVYVTHSGYKWGEYIPRIHRSTDRGDNWEDISGDLPDLAINDVYVHPMHNDSIIFVGTDGGVYGTVDAGTTWGRVGAGMPMVPVYDLEINPVQNTLIAGTFARSIMTYPLDSIQLEIPEDTMTTQVNQFVLPQGVKIYPSPAAEVIQVEIGQLGASRSYDLVILDATGRAVKQQQGTVNGDNITEIRVEDLIPGTYFLKVKVGGIIRTGKFVKG